MSQKKLRKAADKIVEEMKENGEIGRLYRDYKLGIEEARGMQAEHARRYFLH
jgi:hypothetical protein